MGVNDDVNLSSPLRNLSRACACFRNTPKIESGELFLSSSVANGCVPSSCPVTVLYSFDAVSNIAGQVGGRKGSCPIAYRHMAVGDDGSHGGE
jgi:hypothetical protein